MARVSWPSLASLKPVEWRSMWGWIGMPSRVAGAGDELAEGRGGHWRAALGDKNVGRFGIVAEYLAESA
jgi:hypothetical protein